MLIEAAGLAVLAAISPTALLLAAVYLGSARPRATIVLYLIGATVMSIIMGIVVLVILRAGGFSLPRHRTDRYGLRIALGILILLAGLFVARRKPKPKPKPEPEPAGESKGIMARLTANPAPYTAFLAGILIFAPGASFIAAIQVIATSNADLQATVAGLALIVVINVSLIWLPLLAFLLAPGHTTRRLSAFNEWLRRNGRMILACTLVAAGVIVAIDGLVGLIRKG
jgi:Sap, sulfolipid-1-addressing protein